MALPVTPCHTAANETAPPDVTTPDPDQAAQDVAAAQSALAGAAYVQNINGRWTYFAADGQLVGFAQIMANGGAIYTDPNGNVLAGMQHVSDGMQWLDPQGNVYQLDLRATPAGMGAGDSDMRFASRIDGPGFSKEGGAPFLLSPPSAPPAVLDAPPAPVTLPRVYVSGTLPGPSSDVSTTPQEQAQALAATSAWDDSVRSAELGARIASMGGVLTPAGPLPPAPFVQIAPGPPSPVSDPAMENFLNQVYPPGVNGSPDVNAGWRQRRHESYRGRGYLRQKCQPSTTARRIRGFCHPWQ
jgi:hypothetical protein